MKRVRGTAFGDKVVSTVDFVMPWTSVPVIVAGEVENPGALQIKGHVLIRRELIEEVGRVPSLVASAPIICATHVGAYSDALVRPATPHTICVEAHWDDGSLCVGKKACEKNYTQYGLHDYDLSADGVYAVDFRAVKHLTNRLGTYMTAGHYDEIEAPLQS